MILLYHDLGAQWLSGRVLDLRLKGRRFEPHRRHCVVSLSKNINPSLVLVQPRKTRPFITERLLMGRKESNQTKQTNKYHDLLIGIMSMSRVDSSVGNSSNERLCKSTAAKGSSSSSSIDTPAPSSGFTSGKIFVSRLNCEMVDV